MEEPAQENIPKLLESDWQGDAAERARRLYPNQAMHRVATVMALTHRFSIEYMEQCPALITFATWGALPRRREEFAIIANRFGSAVNRRPKLKDMMVGFNGPVQVRKLSGQVCIPSNAKAIMALRQIAPSDLAQAIPEKVGDQLAWMRLLRAWKRRIDRALPFREDERRVAWEWMVKAGSVAIVRDGMKYPEGHVSTIMDMLVHGKVAINPKWTFAGALAAADRWHADLAKKRDQERFLHEHGFGFEDQCDYGALPLEGRVDDLTFTALRSGLDLYVEGAAMHHCVASYVRDVMLGATRIYSIRRGEARIATVELHPQGRGYRVAQLKGPCNHRVAKAVEKAVDFFVKKSNEAIIAAEKTKAKDWTKADAYTGKLE